MEEDMDQLIQTHSLKLGPLTSHSMLTDPKHMVFVLSRYKFCAKMLEGKGHVLEFGCGDAFGTPIVAHDVESLYAVDIDPRLIEDNRERLSKISNLQFNTIDMINTFPPDDMAFDAGFSIDVIEHITLENEAIIMQNIKKRLKKDAVFIIGMPNITAKEYASKYSTSSHINLKSRESLKEMMDRHFINTFIFSMNDEVLHTGFYPMAHYLIAVGCGVRM